MEKEEERAEYVCKETGKIWIGGRYNKYGRPWNFGQVSSLGVRHKWS